MATLTTAPPQNPAESPPPRGWLADVFPWALLLASVWLVGGIYLDGWAHNHGKVDDSFFTQWHVVLYSGYLACAVVLAAALALTRRLPSGYGLSLIGVVVFAIGGLADMLWHMVFGIELDVAALLSPTHLVLALGACLIVAGPLRAAWQRADEQRIGWTGWLLMLASLSMVYAVLTFMTQFAHPLVWPESNADAAHVSVGSEVFVMDVTGGSQTRLTRAHGVSAQQADWSADGRRVAFTTWQPEDEVGSLVVASADGTGQVVLTSGRHDAAPRFPAWSPDGRQIAFVAAREERPDVWVISADGANERRVTMSGVMPSTLAWSPDGLRIAFTAERNGSSWVHTIASQGGDPLPLTQGLGPSWSPDGERIAFGADHTGTGEIYTVAPDGTDLRRLTTTTSTVRRQVWSWWPAWSPDGNKIAFQSNRDGPIDVFVMDADGRNPVNLTDNPSLDSFQASWAPDGQRLSFTARGHAVDPSVNQAFGVASILVQAGLMIGLVLLVARRWRLPLGACTAVFSVNAVLVSFLNDTFQLIPAAVAAGLVADVLLRWLWSDRPRVVAFAIPVVFYGTYFGAVALAYGLGWTVHLWAGAVVLAGVVGWLLSYLAVPLSRASWSARLSE
jgi:Tol biopolymer transport system component